MAVAWFALGCIVNFIALCLMFSFSSLFLSQSTVALPVKIFTTVCISIFQRIIFRYTDYLNHVSWESILINVVGFIIMGYILFSVYFKAHWYQKILMLLFSSTLMILCQAAIFFMLSLFLDIPSITNILLHEPVGLLAIVLYICLYVVIIQIVSSILAKGNSQEKRTQFAENYIGFLLSFATFLILVFALAADQMSNHSPAISIGGLLVTLVMITVNITIFLGTKNDRKQYQLQNDITSMKMQQTQMANTIKQQSESLAKLKGLTHDFKNHLLVLQNSLGEANSNENNAYKEEYINLLLRSIDDLTAFSEVQCEPLQVLLLKTKEVCEQKNITFTANIQYHDFSFMQYDHIAVLFGNALDNALEACLRIRDSSVPKHISLTIYRKANMVFIKLTNTKNTPIKMTGGNYLSSKQGEIHGIGIKNMKHLVSLYNGDLSIQYSENEFCLLISLVADTTAA